MLTHFSLFHRESLKFLRTQCYIMRRNKSRDKLRLYNNVLGSVTKGFYCPYFPFSHFKLAHSDINNGSGMFNFRYYSVMKTLSHIPVAIRNAVEAWKLH